MAVSDKWRKQVAKNAEAYKKARKMETRLTGCPLPIGASGTALVTEVEFTETPVKEDGSGGIPIVQAKLSVEEPENYKGKVLQGQGLTQFVKESEKQTFEEAYSRALDMLQDLGLPKEVREESGHDPEVIASFFDDEPQRVAFDVVKDNFAGNQSGKKVRVSPIVDQDSIPSAEQAEGSAEFGPDDEVVTYLGKPHKIVERDGDILTLMSASGKTRKGVHESKVILED